MKFEGDVVWMKMNLHAYPYLLLKCNVQVTFKKSRWEGN